MPEMKSCELCKLPATTYCESDQASLCWDCDSKVHGANFLVARHLRCLLCQTCQTPTSWKASGARLGHTVSVCERCNREDESQDENDEDGSEDDDPVEKDGENQVVPWSSLADASPSPPAVSSSSSSEDTGGEGDVSASVNSRTRKRRLEDASDVRSREIAVETEEFSGQYSKRRFRDRGVKHGGGSRSGAVRDSGEESKDTIDLNFPKECWSPI